MNIERRTQPTDRFIVPHRAGCLALDVKWRVFLLSFCLLASFRVLGQSQTNALPNLLPPREALPPTFWEQRETAVLVAGFIFLVLVTVVAVLILKPRPPRVIPPAIAAREALAKCRGRPEDGKVLSDISQTLRRYVGVMLGFPTVEFTTAEFVSELERSEKITPQLKQGIAEFLRACDERKFPPAVSSTPLGAADRALGLIDLTENESCRHDNACPSKNERPV